MTQDEIIERLTKLQKLHEAGVITKEELEAQKNLLLHPENPNLQDNAFQKGTSPWVWVLLMSGIGICVLVVAGILITMFIRHNNQRHIDYNYEYVDSDSIAPYYQDSAYYEGDTASADYYYSDSCVAY